MLTLLRFMGLFAYFLTILAAIVVVPLPLLTLGLAAGIVLMLDWCKPRPRKKWIPPMGGA
jgi:hypothetical protein